MIPLKDILRITLSEYCNNNDVKQDAFETVGVNISGKFGTHDSNSFDIISEYANKVPLEAVAVIGYDDSITSCNGKVYYTAKGTALIPRNSISSIDSKIN